jgi:FkbM family methyltransferase
MTSNSKEMPHLASTDRQLLGRLRNLGLELKHFFDVGASNGVWSHQVCEDFPGATFDLFEPLVDFAPEYWQKLGPRLSQHPSFRLHKIALGAECKRIPFYLYPEPANSTTLETNAQESRHIEVDMFTLDYVIEEFRLAIPQALKVDTQGSELNILRGARKTLPQIQVLLLECWLTRAYGPATPLFFEVAQWLRNFGFHLYDLGNAWRDTDGSLVAQDCVFLNQRSKVSRMPSESVAEAPSARQRERLSERVRQFFLTASRRDQKDSKTF